VAKPTNGKRFEIALNLDSVSATLDDATQIEIILLPRVVNVSKATIKVRSNFENKLHQCKKLCDGMDKL
jgi:hypothetical protein